MASANADVHAIFSAAVACSSSTATRRSAACTAVCSGRSVRRASGYVRLLAFGRNGNTRGQISLRWNDGCGRAGCGRKGDKCCGISIGLGCGYIRRRFFSTHLRALRETWGGTSVQFQFGTGGSVWQHGRGDVPQFLVEGGKVRGGLGG